MCHRWGVSDIAPLLRYGSGRSPVDMMPLKLALLVPFSLFTFFLGLAALGLVMGIVHRLQQ